MEHEAWPVSFTSTGICNRAAVDMMHNMVGRRNQGPWRGFPAGTVLCQSVKWSPAQNYPDTVPTAQRDYIYSITLWFKETIWCNHPDMPPLPWLGMEGDFDTIEPHVTTPERNPNNEHEYERHTHGR